MEQLKTALVFGASGLVGGFVTDFLSKDTAYSTVKVFVRKHFHGFEKGEIVIANFDHLDRYESLIQGDEVFCCIGTTINKAGFREAFRKIDYELVLKIATIAKGNGVKHFLVISSLGADASSNNFYLRTKGEMEEALKKLKFDRLGILRPSLLLGKRNELRVGESIGKVLMELFSFMFMGKLKKYKGIEARTVAKAMIKIASYQNGTIIYESDRLEELGKD